MHHAKWMLLSPLLLAGCDMCGNEISQTTFSPSGEFKAVAFNRNCGATTGSNTQISIIPSHRELQDDSGNLFITDAESEVRMTWSSDNSLKVELSYSGRVMKKLDSVSGVSAAFVLAENP